MTWLAIDTTGPVCAAALVTCDRPGTVLAARTDEIGRGHAERLPMQIEEILAEASIGHADLTGIAVAAGPGSFTGVRIGVAMARGLALALEIPAHGIDGLAAVIETIRAALPVATADDAGLIVAARDARRGQIFIRAEATQPGRPPVVESAAVAADDPPAIPGDRPGRQPIRLAGSAAPAMAETLASRGVTARVDSASDVPSLQCLVAMARDGRGTSPPVPVYLRAPDAKAQTDVAGLRRQYGDAKQA